MAIATLPITPGKDRPFLTLTTPLVADFAQKITGESLRIMTNVVGYRAQDQGAELAELFKQQLRGLGVTDSRLFCHDAEPLFTTYVNNVLLTLYLRGFIRFEDISMCWCSCGRVEIAAENLEQLDSEERKRTLVTKTSQGWQCRSCHSNLARGIEQVAICHFGNILMPNVDPLLTAEAKRIWSRILATPCIISRNHRHEGQKVRLGDTEILLDTDFRWLSYLGYLYPDATEITLISATITMNQALKVLALSQLLWSKVSYRLWVHPLIRVADQRTSISRLTIPEFFERTPHANAARAFMALGLQWRSAEATLPSGDLHWAITSTSEITSSLNNQQSPPSPIEGLIAVQRENTLTLLKAIRRKTNVFSDQQQLISQALFV